MCSAVQCSAVQCSAVQCSAVQCMDCLWIVYGLSMDRPHVQLRGGCEWATAHPLARSCQHRVASAAYQLTVKGSLGAATSGSTA
jgi:hypothetical protein